MAYSTVSVITKSLLVTDFIPDFVGVINTNNATLKSYIEDLYNNLKVGTGVQAGKIGASDDPIVSVYSKKFNVKLVTSETGVDDGDGIYFKKNDGTTTGSRIAMVDGVVTAVFGSLDVSGDVIIGGNLNLDGDVTLDDVLLKGTLKRTVSNEVLDPDLLVLTSSVIPVTFKNESTSSLVVVNSDMSSVNNNIITIMLDIPTGTTKPIDGQEFTIVIGDLGTFDATSVVVYMMSSTGGNYSTSSFVNGTLSNKILFSTGDYIPFGKSIDIIILESNKIFVKNIY